MRRNTSPIFDYIDRNRNNIHRISMMIDSESPIQYIALASFDMLSGIQVHYIWKIGSDKEIINLGDIFRIILGNVHRQPDSYFNNYPCSFIEFESLKMKVLSSSFTIMKTTQTKTFYSIAFFIKSTHAHSSPECNHAIGDHLQRNAALLKQMLSNQSSLLDFVPNLHESVTEIGKLLQAYIPKSLISFVAIPPDSDCVEFYAKALSAHIESQMTTIIELDDKFTVPPVYGFLAQFLLPYQLELSSAEPNEVPIPGLYLQMVKPSGVIPVSKMMSFKRPWTWINYSAKTLYKSVDVERQLVIYNKYRNSIALVPELSEEDIMAKINKIVPRSYYLECQAAKWSIETVKLIQKIQNNMIISVCKMKLEELMNKSLTLIHSVNDLFEENGSVTPEQMRLIQTCLEISDETELRMISSFARLFDSQIYRRIFQDKATFYSMLMSV